MTPRERRAAAAMLRRWAEVCEREPITGWLTGAVRGPAWEIIPVQDAYAVVMAWCGDGGGFWDRDYHTGTDAATGLCLAAAMIEAGDHI